MCKMEAKEVKVSVWQKEKKKKIAARVVRVRPPTGLDRVAFGSLGPDRKM